MITNTAPIINSSRILADTGATVKLSNNTMNRIGNTACMDSFAFSFLFSKQSLLLPVYFHTIYICMPYYHTPEGKTSKFFLRFG